MKRLILLIPIVLLSACASKPPKKIVIVPALTPSRPVNDLESVRRSEEIREYRFGRYVDPGNQPRTPDRAPNSVTQRRHGEAESSP